MTLSRWRFGACSLTLVGLSLAGCGDEAALRDEGLASGEESSLRSEEDASGLSALRDWQPPTPGYGPALFTSGNSSDLLLAREISLDLLEARLEARNDVDTSDLAVTRQFVDELRMAHTRVRQTVNGVPVWGGEAIVHLNQDGTLFAITDTLVRNVRVNTGAGIGQQDAIGLAVDAYGCDDCLTAAPVADLWVLRHGGEDHLAWRVQLRREDGTHHTAMPVIFIDAHTGAVVWQYDNLQTASGTSLYSGNVTITTSKKSTTFYMEDLTRKMGTFDNRNSTSSTYRFTDTDDVWSSTTQKAGVDAHYGAAMVYDYFKNVHGRIGIDGAGGPAYYTAAADGVTGLISSRVHYSSGYNNAFWNGQLMTYGDGDGSNFGPLVTLDICGHEMTHGVTERTAGLIYSNESGALNESMSDVFGALVERYARGESTNTWRIGEETYTPGVAGDALRYMDNPHGAGNAGFTSDDDPDHYSERYTGTGDSGGVHINSGIPNKVFYLLAKGGTHHKGGSMTGIGADSAGKIWYKALTTYMTTSTNFAGARTATLNAAAALFGATSPEYIAVGNAWGLCGVGTVDGGGGDTGGGTDTQLISNGGFETSANPWVLAGNAYHTANGNYPAEGTGYLYLGSLNYGSGTAYQQITIPSTATTAGLTFQLNVGSTETTTTTAYDKLYVEVRNSSGTLLSTLATYSNLNKAADGVYSAKGADLLAYKGQTIRLTFRATTDSSAATTFRIDNVSVK